MFTLYDLLEADPKADKAGLKEAFRKAAKASHPDVCPDDADAPWRFRQIVRAHEILSDDELRTAYDHVVAFERRMEQERRSRLLDNVLTRIVSGAATAAIFAIIVFGGYALSAHLAEAPLSVAAMPQLDSDELDEADLPLSRAESDAGRPARKADAGLGPVLAALHEVALETPIPVVVREPASAPEASNVATNESTLPDAALRDAEAALGPVPDHARRDAKFFYMRGLIAYRFGDFGRALANYDAALRLDPSFERAYRDRSAVFALTSRYDRAAADLAQADRIRRAHVVVKHRPSRARAVAQDALWRQIQRAHFVDHVVDHVVDHAADHLILSERNAAPWPAGG
jgi:curved DNA-binding protein CbpA